jgi:fatty-acyl-CoA synthase
VAAWLGIAAAGGVTALLNTHLSGQSLAHCICLARPKLAIVSPPLLDRFSGCLEYVAPELCSSMRIVMHEPGLAQPSSEREIDTSVSINDPALLIYTSGTTGFPKAARVSHRRIMNWSFWFKGMAEMTPADRIYNCLPLYHSVGGVVAVGSLLAAGGSVAIAPKFSLSSFWEDVCSYDCTLFQYIGELCRYLVNAPPDPHERHHRLRMAIGNGLAAGVWERFRERFAIPKILEFYASTEGNFSLYNAEGKPGSIGRVPSYLAHRFPVALVRHDDAAGIPLRGENGLCVRVARGETGEAVGRVGAGTEGGGEFEGYTDRADTELKILRNVFANGDKWFRTGDLMRCDAAGFYYFVDRIGDTFRWKGENVSTSEVAAIAASCPGVVEAVVYGVAVPGSEGRAGMAKLVVGEGFDLAVLRTHLRAALPSYAVPIFLRIGTSLDATETFKYKKMELVKEGFDPVVSKQQFYVEDHASGHYVPLDRDMHARILAGYMRL